LNAIDPMPTFPTQAFFAGADRRGNGLGRRGHIAPRHGGGVFIYADESGNSGRRIFHTQPIYRQGAILAVEDVQPALEAVILPFLAAEHLNRIHAHQLPEETVASLGTKILDALNNTCPWTFHITEIEKSYIGGSSRCPRLINI
jgi:hypothetical protein